MSPIVVIENEFPLSVIQSWPHWQKIKTIEQMPAGFSGALVYRCRDTKGNVFALKRWPVGTKPQRVRQVHDVVSQVRDIGCQLLPQIRMASSGSSVVVDDNQCCWEIAQWLPGKALPRDATAGLVAAGASAIASFHRVAASSLLNASSRATKIPSPAVMARVDRLRQLHQELPLALAAELPKSFSEAFADALNRARQLLRIRWSTASQQITRDLNRWTSRPVTTQYVLRDVHRNHVLFAKDSGTLQPRGIIDFDALGQDCAAVDLARWLGSFRGGSGSDEARLNAAVAGYRRNWQFNEDQLSLAQTLLHVSPWVNLANWVVWMGLRTRTFDNDELAIAGRISEIVDQITDRL